MANLCALALLAAIAVAITEILIKRWVAEYGEYLVSWGRYAFALPVLWVALLFAGMPSVQPGFYLIIAAMMPLEVAITLLMTKAFKRSDISRALPFTAFTPLFAAGLAFLFLDEALSAVLLVALLLLVVGVYIMDLEKGHVRSPFAPFRRLATDRSAMYVLLASALIGCTITLAKLAIVRSSALFFCAVYFLLFTAIFTPIFFGQEPREGPAEPRAEGWAACAYRLLQRRLLRRRLGGYKLRSRGFVLGHRFHQCAVRPLVRWCIPA